MSWTWFPRWLLSVLIVIIVIIVVVLVVGALGGFDWRVLIGHFHWDVGVTKGALGALLGGAAW